MFQYVTSVQNKYWQQRQAQEKQRQAREMEAAEQHLRRQMTYEAAVPLRDAEMEKMHRQLPLKVRNLKEL